MEAEICCENTRTEIPYLTIVNEVLEDYLVAVVSGDIYEHLSDPGLKRSFGTPFHLPVTELRLYPQPLWYHAARYLPDTETE